MLINRLNGLKQVGLNAIKSKLTMSTNPGIQRLNGKVAIVTASTDGIGLAVVERLAREGAKVVLSSRKEKNVQAAVEQLKSKGLTSISGIVCHVGKKEDRLNLFKHTEEKFGGLDILVSNAAVNPATGPVLDCPEDVWDKIFDVNVKSAFMLSQEALPYLRKRNGGSIIYVSSVAGYVPISLLGAYSVSKTALLGLTKAAAADLVLENIRVNCVAPGLIQTKFSSALHESEIASEISLSGVPMKRFGQPSEIAAVVAFLASDDASYMTGETILATGGMTARL